MPRSPNTEAPSVASRVQVLTLFRQFTLDQRMVPGTNYALTDAACGIWRWKTRTVRLAGIYLGDENCFVVAAIAFARDLNRHGKAVVALEHAFADVAAHRLTEVRLLRYALIMKDPHYDQTQPFDPF